ncbi:hypothetical protein D3C75_1333390 [compost metagenome]
MNRALKEIGVHMTTLDAPEAARPILAASYKRALTTKEQKDLISSLQPVNEHRDRRCCSD